MRGASTVARAVSGMAQQVSEVVVVVVLVLDSSGAVGSVASSSRLSVSVCVPKGKILEFRRWQGPVLLRRRLFLLFLLWRSRCLLLRRSPMLDLTESVR